MFEKIKKLIKSITIISILLYLIRIFWDIPEDDEFIDDDEPEDGYYATTEDD